MDDILQAVGKPGRSTLPCVSIVVLAAGRSSRMKDQGHKLLAHFSGVPLLRKSVLSAIASDSQAVVVVMGERRAELTETIADLDVSVVENTDFASGLASSIRVGVMTAQERKPDGVLIALADMPTIEASQLDRLIVAFREHMGTCVIRATGNDRPGNPVIFPSTWFERLSGLSGDGGARALLKDNAAVIVDVEIGEAALIDVDTPEELIAAGGVPFTRDAQGTVSSPES